MQNNNNVSRRDFLHMATAATGATYLKLGSAALVAITQAACAAKEESSAFKVLGPAEARDLAAIAARIIPTTGTPGASEAGVVYFFDRAFAEEMQDQLAAARDGLASFQEALSNTGHSKLFAELSDEEQDAFLQRQQDSDFFALVREMTIFGFFAMSSYGGNREHIGWDLLGFEGHHGAWTYPFGYYDAEYAKEQSNGE